MIKLSDANAFIFDWDNTLVDSWHTIAHCLNHVFQYYDLPLWSLEEVQEKSQHSLKNSFPKLFGDQWEAAGAVYYKEFRSIHLDRLRPFEASQSLLQALSSHYALGIISNKTQLHLDNEVKALGWNDYFQFLYGSGSASHDKPHQSAGIMACETLKLTKDKQIFYIGDTGLDMEFAYACGFSAILIGESIKNLPPSKQADYHFPTIEAFFTHMKGSREC